MRKGGATVRRVAVGGTSRTVPKTLVGTTEVPLWQVNRNETFSLHCLSPEFSEDLCGETQESSKRRYLSPIQPPNEGRSSVPTTFSGTVLTTSTVFWNFLLKWAHTVRPILLTLWQIVVQGWNMWICRALPCLMFSCFVFWWKPTRSPYRSILGRKSWCQSTLFETTPWGFQHY